MVGLRSQELLSGRSSLEMAGNCAMSFIAYYPSLAWTVEGWGPHSSIPSSIVEEMLCSCSFPSNLCANPAFSVYILFASPFYSQVR